MILHANDLWGYEEKSKEYCTDVPDGSTSIIRIIPSVKLSYTKICQTNITQIVKDQIFWFYISMYHISIMAVDQCSHCAGSYEFLLFLRKMFTCLIMCKHRLIRLYLSLPFKDVWAQVSPCEEVHNDVEIFSILEGQEHVYKIPSMQ